MTPSALLHHRSTSKFSPLRVTTMPPKSFAKGYLPGRRHAIYYRRSQRIAVMLLQHALAATDSVDVLNNTHAALSPLRRSKRLIEQQIQALTPPRHCISESRSQLASLLHHHAHTIRASPSMSPSRHKQSPSRYATTKQQLQFVAPKATPHSKFLTRHAPTSRTNVCKCNIAFTTPPRKHAHYRPVDSNSALSSRPPAPTTTLSFCICTETLTDQLLQHLDDGYSDSKWVWQRCSGVPFECRVSFANTAARRGKMLELACAQRDPLLVRAVYARSQLSTHSNDPKWHFVDAVHYGVEYGLTHLLPWLDAIETDADPSLSFTSDSRLMNMALVRGDLCIAQWLFAKRLQTRREVLLPTTVRALGRHSVELLEWVVAHYRNAFGTSAIAIASGSTCASSLVVVLTTPSLFLDAASRLSNKAPSQMVFATALDEAVANNNVAVVQYLIAHGLEHRLTAAALATAAARGHSDVLALVDRLQAVE